MSDSSLWTIAVEAPLMEALTYRKPENLILTPGTRVQVPLGHREKPTFGVAIQQVSELPKDLDPSLIKNIECVDETRQNLPEGYLQWAQWMANYYQHPLGMVLQLFFPQLKFSERKRRRKGVIPQIEMRQPFALNPEQQRIFLELKASQGFQTHVLFGVTGSGKTEIYLELIEEKLRQGLQCLFLVPEISLTPQLVQRFAQRFGNQIAVVHSQLSPIEKTEQWLSISSGEKKVLIGARSALFCPIPRLGLIVLDEEHEPSFKQDEKLKYHGRDCAIYLARQLNIPVVLGSATPSLETWKNVLEKKYQLHVLKKRVKEVPLPEIKVVDMRLREVATAPGLPSWLSAELFEAIQSCLIEKKQVALFLNRRGSASFVLCGDCGHIAECPDCDIKLTLHGKNHLVCHYCDYHEPLPDHCPSCREGLLKPIGLGTEQIEEDVRKLFPEARVDRADRDEVQTRTELETLIEKMEQGETDILVGTQMIAKGLDFKNLQLVGVVLADIGFSMPDFRSSERSFQLLLQMAGRAGRHVLPDQRPGEVLIQTFNPLHPSVQFALQGDFEGFAQQELEARQELGYPPHGRIISLRMSSTSREKALQAAALLRKRMSQLSEKPEFASMEFLGPTDAPISRLRGRFRMQALLKSPNLKALHWACRALLGDLNWLPKSVQLTPDVDPLHLL